MNYNRFEQAKLRHCPISVHIRAVVNFASLVVLVVYSSATEGECFLSLNYLLYPKCPYLRSICVT